MPQELPIDLDRSSTVPLYAQLAEQLVGAIHSGRLHPGDPFENEVQLAERLNLSRPTVRRALAVLVTQGLVVRRRGIGTVVSSRIVHPRSRLTSLFDDLSAGQRHPSTQVLICDHDVVNARAARALELPTTTRFVHLQRLRSIGRLPLAILTNWLPAHLPGANALTPTALEQRGLYEILREHDVHPTVARQTFGARNATGRERHRLSITRAVPLLTMTRRAKDADGQPVEFGDHCYRGDHYTIDVTVTDQAPAEPSLHLPPHG